MKKGEIVACPYCGYEYLAGEIFIPKALLGHPTSILRDDDNKIISYSGIEPDNHEQFVCTNCNSLFKVSARMSFTAFKTKTSNFDEEYVCDLSGDKITLDELA